MDGTGLINAEILEQISGDSQRRQAGQSMINAIEYSMYQPQDFLNRSDWERELLGLIALGNPSLLQEYLNSHISGDDSAQFPEFAEDALNKEKFMGVILVTLASRAAMEGGLPEHISFSISDGYIWSIEHAISSSQISEMRIEAVNSFCNAVHNHQLEHLSSPVRRCCDYMALRMHATITLKELSKVCHFSPHYISDLFRKELGMGAVQYYHHNKLLYARYLLKNTSMTVSEIAARLSYPSHSNFTQRFKREFGMTPQQFRGLLRCEEE